MYKKWTKVDAYFPVKKHPWGKRTKKKIRKKSGLLPPSRCWGWRVGQDDNKMIISVLSTATQRVLSGTYRAQQGHRVYSTQRSYHHRHRHPPPAVDHDSGVEGIIQNRLGGHHASQMSLLPVHHHHHHHHSCHPNFRRSACPLTVVGLSCIPHTFNLGENGPLGAQYY